MQAALAAAVGWGGAAQAQVVKGNGTTSTVPVWTGNATIGNSIVSQGGGNPNVSGGMKASGEISAPSFSGSFSGNGSGLSNAFGLGEDEKHISTVDSEGVALAAIQHSIGKRKEKVSQLKDRLAALVARLATLESSK